MADPCLEIINAFEGLVQEHGGDELLTEFRQMGKEQRLALADEIFERVEGDVRRAKLTASAWDFLQNYIKKQKDKKKAFSDLMSGGGVRERGIVSLERRQESILQQFEAKLYEGLEHYRPRRFGLLHSREGQRNIIRELYQAGISGDKDAAQFVKIYKEASDYLRKLYNNAGGNVQKLFDWNLPQYHDAVRIGRTKKEEWVPFVKELIDKDRLGPYKIGEDGVVRGAKMSDEVVDELLGRVYDNLASGGVLHKELAVNPNMRRMMAKHHQEHRILNFKDADSWMAYSDKFGSSDYVQSLHANAELMSREIAAMQNFGPNPDMMVKKLRLTVQKASGNRDEGALGEMVYDQIMGRMYTNNTKLADTMRGVRNVSVGIKIGKAAISALSDMAFFGITRRFNNLPVFKGYMNLVKGLTGSKEHRMLAAHLHLGARYAIDNAKSAYRISEVMGVGGTARFADFVVKASGLDFWTNTVRQTFGLDYLHHLGGLTDRLYQNLPPMTRKAFKRYGITPGDWDRVRVAPHYEKSGARYLNPGAFDDDELTHKIVGMIGEETDFAVPEPNAKVMTILRGKGQPGTVAGEVMRSIGMFKSFSTSVVMSHWLRALNLSPKNRMTYFASLITGTTVLGAMAIQTKQIVDGKTPMDTSRAFWAAAFLQGGGTGILGDFLFQDHTRVGSAAEFLGGPLAADISTALGLVFGPASDFAQARNDIAAKAGARGARTIDKLIPNLWQTNLIARRYLSDQVQYLLNPNWRSQQRAMKKRLRNERGQHHYWEPGKLTPGA